LGDSGEFTGFAWTQNGEQFAIATLQSVDRREGSIFKMYSLDMMSDGVDQHCLVRGRLCGRDHDFQSVATQISGEKKGA